VIILIGGEKGGSSKSTLATNIAVVRALSGRDVFLLDTDIQGSASLWSQLRDEADIKPRISCMQKFGQGVQAAVRDLATRYDDIIIDAGGRDSAELRASLVVAHRVYTPVQSSQFDLWSLEKMDELVATANGFNEALRAYIVITRAPTNVMMQEVQEARAFLQDFEHYTLARTIIYERSVWRKASRQGCSIVELDRQDYKASNELKLLCEEIFSE
jgi:chromosome partitioning protein